MKIYSNRMPKLFNSLTEQSYYDKLSFHLWVILTWKRIREFDASDRFQEIMKKKCK